MKKSELVTVVFRMSEDNVRILSSIIDMESASENKQVVHVAQIVQRAIARAFLVFRDK